VSVPTSAAVSGIASFLTSAVPVTHGYGANEAPSIASSVLDIDRMYGIVYPVDMESFPQALAAPTLGSFLFQVSLVAGTRAQVDMLGDRVTMALVAGPVPDVVSDVGAWQRTISFMDVMADGISLSRSPAEHLHTFDARFVAELTLA
jgi:hypothetical protein